MRPFVEISPSLYKQHIGQWSVTGLVIGHVLQLEAGVEAKSHWWILESKCGISGRVGCQGGNVLPTYNVVTPSDSQISYFLRKLLNIFPYGFKTCFCSTLSLVRLNDMRSWFICWMSQTTRWGWGLKLNLYLTPNIHVSHCPNAAVWYS